MVTNDGFPVGLPLTRENFIAWFDVIYEIALGGAFSAKLAPFGGVEIGHRNSSGNVMRDTAATRREAKMDALHDAVELVYA
jgi:hypothetical protein